MTELVDKILSNKSKEELSKILQSNIQYLHKYDCSMINVGRKLTTRENNLRTIIVITKEISKQYKEWTKSDIEEYFIRLSTDPKLKVKPYTKEIRKAIITKFFRWLYEKTSHDDAPEVVSSLKINHKSYDKFLNPNDFLTENEVKSLIDTCDHPRDSCFIMVLYESGARISEVLSLNIKDVEFIGDAVKTYIRKSKTKRRPVDLLISAPYIQAWIQKHPKRDNPDAPFFISFSPATYGTRLMSHSTLEILQKLKYRCGIKKKVNHHLFRHMAITRCILDGMPIPAVKRRFGLSNNTNVLERYSWISDEDVENSYRVACGYEPNKTDRNNIDILKPKKCWRCKTPNPVTNKYCDNCYTHLDYETVSLDLEILEMLKTKYAEFEGVNLKNMLTHFKQFRAETNDLSTLLDCFNGSDEVSIPEVRRRLDLKDDDALNLLQYLMTGGFIDIKMDTVKLLDKEKFKNYILMQKRYLEN
jgi:site-specific recombinase XerD